MGVISEGLRLIGEGVGRIVNQGPLGTFEAQGLIEGMCHAVEFDERNVFTTGHGAHGFGIVAMGITKSLLVIIEEPTSGGRDKDDVTTLLSDTVGKYLQVAGVTVPRTVASPFLFLVVMAELTDDVIPIAQLRENLIQSQLGEEGGGRESAFGIVGNDHPLVKPTGNHLTPGSPGFLFLIHNGAVAAKEDGDSCSIGFDGDALHGRSRTTELQIEYFVPILVTQFTRLEFDAGGGINRRLMLVDGEGNGLELSFLSGYQISIVPTRLSTDNSLGSPFLRAECDGDTIIAVGHLHGEIDRTVTICI